MSYLIGNYLLTEEKRQELIEKIISCLEKEENMTIASAKAILDSAKVELENKPLR